MRWLQKEKEVLFGCECTNCTNILQSTQPEVVAMSDTEMREIALEENDDLSHELDVIVGE